MKTINVPNINHALYHGFMLLNERGKEISPRGQRTVEYPGPVATTYLFPEERVLFCPKRRANPYFHLFEALWILAGREDVDFLKFFNKQMAEYSDDGRRFHGAYGARLRYRYHVDQLKRVIDMLAETPDTRRAVLQIWQTDLDLDKSSKDIPCNDMVFLKLRGGQLHMTVCCRSNDMIWGAYGANIVQFSMIQEYIANHLNATMGYYTQISDSFHIYPDLPVVQKIKDSMPGTHDLYYNRAAVEHYTGKRDILCEPFAFGDPERWDRDLALFFKWWDEEFYDDLSSDVECELDFESRYFNLIVKPMFNSWAYHKIARKAGSIAYALPFEPLTEMPFNNDWRWAAHIWMNNRKGWNKDGTGSTVRNTAGSDS